MNAILPHRQKPLTVQEYIRLQKHVEKYFVLKPRMVGKSVPVKDYDGIVYRWERDIVQEGYDLTEISPAPPELIDSMLRPATPTAIKEHLFTLSRMKRYTGGDAGLFVIAAEITRHLPDCSEFVFKTVCDSFALDADSDFFPTPARLIEQVKRMESDIKKPDPIKAAPAEEKPFEHKRTEKTKRRVARLVKLCCKRNLTCWERKFMEGMKP